MILCYGVFIKILNLWKPSKRNPSQKLLQNTILSSIFPAYTLSGITDSVSTDLARCKQGLSKDVTDAAREILKEGKAKETAVYFQKRLIDSGFLKSDEKSAATIVSLFLSVIENDTSIHPLTVVDKVGGASKKELLTQHDFVLSDLLAGIFLYTVSIVDNRLGRDFSSQIDEDFVRQFPQKDIHVLPQPVSLEEADKIQLPEEVELEEADKVQLPPEVEELIRSCNHTLYDTQNRVRVYGSWDELDFDSVYVLPYLHEKSVDKPNIQLSSKWRVALEESVERSQERPAVEVQDESVGESQEKLAEEAQAEEASVTLKKRYLSFLHTSDLHLSHPHPIYTNIFPSLNISVVGFSSGISQINHYLPAHKETLDSLNSQPPDSDSQEEHSIPERRERIGSVFEKDDIIYVVGGAGYGKSLFLKNLCVNPSILKTFDEKPLLIIRGDIKRLIRPDGCFKTMMEFLEECFAHDSLRDPDEMYPDLLELCLKAGRCLILLDALDEVGNDQRSELHHLIVSYFENTYPHNKVCITSRERGFIPKRSITCFYIAPITINDVEEYMNRFIHLKKFNANEKSRFVEQASILVDKKFIKGFLTLSLLLAIYKNDQQLPVNKFQLYQKCFEYMATHREKSKNLIRNSVTDEKYDWVILLRLMSDATFMELARLGAPNNADIPEDKIKTLILSLYQMKFDSEGECHAATEMFLQFCADRTEVFIPSPNSNLEYRFFHRSFYEYFYAKSIDVHTQTVSETYRELCQFDVDSEVFELLLTIYDLNKPLYLRQLVSYAFEQTEMLLSASDTQSAQAFDILVMMMQIIDDRDFIERLILLLLKEGSRIGKLHLAVTFQMIDAVIKKNLQFFTDSLYANEKFYLLKIQSWLIHDFLRKELLYRDLLSEKGQTGAEQKTRNGFAYSALLSLLPEWGSLLDDWFFKFSNTKYLLGVKKLRSNQAESLASFAKDLTSIENGKRYLIYTAMLSEI